jgi:hypothetical protein
MLLLYITVCGALRFGGCAQAEDQMGAKPMPHSFSISTSCNCNFNYNHGVVLASEVWLYLCLGCRRKKLYSDLFQGLLTKGRLFVVQYVGEVRSNDIHLQWNWTEGNTSLNVLCNLPIFLHGELEIPFCLPLFMFFLLLIMLFSSNVSYVKRRITQT